MKRATAIAALLLVAAAAPNVSAQCLSDRDGNGEVTVNEIVCSVRNSLGGCAAQSPGCAPVGGAGVPSIYGDGSAGLLSVADGAMLQLNQVNTQYSSITVDGTLFVPSGTTLRVTGNVTVNGIIYVSTYAHAGGVLAPTTASVGTRPASAGQA